MDRTYCFSCGADMRPDPAIVAPLCDNCRFEKPSFQVDQVWMIRQRGERPRGPYKRDVMEEWINKNRIEASDEACRPGGPWKPLAGHEDFRAWFTPGDLLYQRRLTSRVDQVRQRTGEDRARHKKVLVWTCIAVGGLALTPISLKTRLTVIPESVISEMGVRWRGLYDRASNTLDLASGETSSLDVARLTNLPGDAIILNLHATHRPDTRPYSLLLMKGLSLVHQDDPASLESAMSLLELAVIIAPRDVKTLTALVGVYAIVGQRVPDRANDAVTLLSRAAAIDPESPLVFEARAQVSLATKSYDSARIAAEDCLKRDAANLECRYLEGLALIGMKEPEKAREILSGLVKAAPHIARYQLGLGIQALEAEDFSTADKAVQSVLDTQPGSARGHALAARLRYQVGDWRNALREARRAASIDPGDLDSRAMAAEIAFALDGPADAIEILEPIGADPNMAAWSRIPEIYLMTSQAWLSRGNTEKATEYANKALETRPGWGPGVMALALSHAKAGNLATAETTFKDGSVEGLSNLDSARFYAAQGWLYRAEGRDKAALAGYEQAVEYDASYLDARVGIVATYLRLGNLSKALDALTALSPLDFEQSDTHAPYALCPPMPLPLAELKADLHRAIANDLHFSGRQPLVDGILAFIDGNLPEAESQLAEVLRDDESNDVARAFLGRVALRKGANEEAVAFLERVASTQGQQGLYPVLLGLAQARLGNYEAAGKSFDAGMQNVEAWPGPHRYRAEALFREGKKAEGIVEARKAWTLDPQDYAARRLVLENTR